MSLNRLYNSLRSPLKLYWWRYDYPQKLNFGDEITPEIIERIWGRKTTWSPPSECEVAGAGSIIEIMQELSNGNHIKVWGSGFIKPGVNNSHENLDFYAVRGKKTLARIRNRHDVTLGDPGLLANLVYKSSSAKKYKVGIVAHYVDLDNPIIQPLSSREEYLVINPLDSPQKVVKDITSCEIIFSSSLHGLIISDSFGIPNYWMPLSQKLTGGDYKFTDYYSSTDRKIQLFSAEKLMNNKLIESFIEQYKPVTNLSELQEGLIKSFPIH